MQRHICLVIPPSVFLLDERVFKTLGILRIAAVLREAGWSVDVLDLSGYSNYLDVVRTYIRTHPHARRFGLTATTPQLPAATALSEVIRAAQPGARVILGGPHVTLVNAAVLREKKMKRTGTKRATNALTHLTAQFDVLVAGDGEKAIFAACEPDAQTLIDADGKQSPLYLNEADLESLPWPARDLVEGESYQYRIDGELADTIIAQLGCPFGCGFCGGRFSPMLRHIRTRSAENIVNEMVHVYRTTGRRGFMFYDDELNVNKGMVELMRKIKEAQDTLGTSWRLRGFIKSELFTEEQAAAMYAAGFRWILVGFESGSPRILTNIDKQATREENSRCVEIAHRHGLKVKALMSLGHPGESPNTVRETEEWLLSARPDDFDVTVITCYPGTPYYDDAIEEPGKPGVWAYRHRRTGDILYQEEVDHTREADYYKGIPGEYVSHVWTEMLDRHAIVAARDGIEKRVREALSIPYPTGAAPTRFEHSMGASGPLPERILRSAAPRT